MKEQDTVRSLALLGARVRLAELEQSIRDTKDVIRALQSKTSPRKTKKKKRQKHSDQFKAAVVADARSSSVSKAATKHKVGANLIYRWMKR